MVLLQQKLMSLGKVKFSPFLKGHHVLEKVEDHEFVCGAALPNPTQEPFKSYFAYKEEYEAANVHQGGSLNAASNPVEDAKELDIREHSLLRA